ncbi:MAG TPA: hypothetical protein VKC60_15590, partial [Opitutaceae bacterium]|nr:hypothetical protein [Opitutaceae bacterium]
DAVANATWKSVHPSGYAGEIQRTVDDAALAHLMVLATNDTAPAQVRAIAAGKLSELQTWLTANLSKVSDVDERSHEAYTAAQITRFQTDTKSLGLPKPSEPPPGQPIGASNLGCDFEL